MLLTKIETHIERARRGPNEGYPKISIIVRNQNS